MDGITFAAIEAAGLGKWLAGLREELVSKTYRPDPVRRVMGQSLHSLNFSCVHRFDPNPMTNMGRMIRTKTVVHVTDLAAESAYIEQREPGIVAAVEIGGRRAEDY